MKIISNENQITLNDVTLIQSNSKYGPYYVLDVSAFNDNQLKQIDDFFLNNSHFDGYFKKPITNFIDYKNDKQQMKALQVKLTDKFKAFDDNLAMLNRNVVSFLSATNRLTCNVTLYSTTYDYHDNKGMSLYLYSIIIKNFKVLYNKSAYYYDVTYNNRAPAEERMAPPAPKPQTGIEPDMDDDIPPWD